MNRRFVNLAWTVGACAMLWMAKMGTATAQVRAPELDQGTAAAGIVLAVGTAILLAERYRRRG